MNGLKIGPRGGAGNKWLLMIIACGTLAGAGIFRLLAQQGEKKELASRLEQVLREREGLDSQIKAVRNTLEPLLREVELLRSAGGQTQIKKEPPLPEKEKEKEKELKTPSLKGLRDKERSSDIEQRLANIKNYKKGIEEQNIQLKNRIEELTLSLQKKEEAVSGLKDDNRDLKNELDKVSRAQGELQGKLIASLSDAEVLKKQLGDRLKIEARTAELNNMLQLLKDTNSAMEKELLKVRQDKALFEEELKKAGEQLQSQASGNIALNKKIAELTEILTSKESEKLGLLRELEDLRQARKALEDKLRETGLSQEASRDELNQLNSRLAQLNASSETMKNTVNQLSGLLAKKEEESAAGKSEIASLREEMNKLTLARDTLASALNEKEKNILSLNEKLSRMESQLISLQAELASVKENHQRTAEQLSRMKTLNSSLRDKFLNISKALEPVYLEGDIDSQQDKLKADELRKKVEVELDLEKQ